MAKELLEEVAKYGTATVKRAYGDRTTQNLSSWKEHLHWHAIQPMQQFAYTKGKNAVSVQQTHLERLAHDRQDGVHQTSKWTPMSDPKSASRRRHDAELKRQVIAACSAPGASVAQVAMSYGLNANLVHKWRRLAGHDGEPAGSPAFVPVSVVTEAPPCEPPQSIELELQRGPVHVRVRWPMAGAASCAAWLREMLR